MNRSDAYREVMDAYSEYKKTKLLIVLSTGASLVSGSFELENAFDHLFKAEQEKDEEKSQAEYNKAKAHISRATIDNVIAYIADKTAIINMIVKDNKKYAEHPEAPELLKSLKATQDMISSDEPLDIKDLSKIMKPLLDNMEYLETIQDTEERRDKKSKLLWLFAVFVSGVITTILLYLLVGKVNP